MRIRIGNIIFGLFFIVAGIGYAGNVFDFWNFTLFFDGFWTMFLIIPAALDIFKNGFKAGNSIILATGIVFLVRSQDFFGINILNKMFWPAFLVLIGVIIIFARGFSRKPYQFVSESYQRNISAVFSGKDIRVDEKLSDMRIESIFGGVNLDLRNAIIDSDVNIHVEAVFGGVNLYMPQNVEVIVSDSSVFGGVTNRTAPNYKNDAKKIYLTTECVFGGVEIK